MGTCNRHSPIQVEAVADGCCAWDVRRDETTINSDDSSSGGSPFMGLRAGHRVLRINHHELASSDGKLFFSLHDLF